jgi:hypothetical protein
LLPPAAAFAQSPKNVVVSQPDERGVARDCKLLHRQALDPTRSPHSRRAVVDEISRLAYRELIEKPVLTRLWRNWAHDASAMWCCERRAASHTGVAGRGGTTGDSAGSKALEVEPNR